MTFARGLSQEVVEGVGLVNHMVPRAGGQVFMLGLVAVMFLVAFLELVIDGRWAWSLELSGMESVFSSGNSTHMYQCIA